jgi:hypothetical protein
MLIASRMRQKHNIHFVNFDMTSLRVIWFRWARFWLAAHRNESSRERQMQKPADGRASGYKTRASFPAI